MAVLTEKEWRPIPLWLYGLLAFILICCAAVTAGERPFDLQNEIAVILKPSREATLSAEVTAACLAVKKELGQSFREGEVLIKLDPGVYEAEVARAEVELAAATQALESIQNLFKGDSVTRSKLREVETSKRLAEISLELARRNLAHCTVTAPFSGRVLAEQVHAYELVSPGKELLQIVDDETLSAQFFLPSALLPRLTLGGTIPIRLDDRPGETVTATVSHISRAIDTTSATLEVRATLKNDAGLFRIGMAGRIPLAAIASAREGP